MDKTPRDKKCSFLKTKLGGFAVKLSEGSQKLNQVMSRLVETERSVIQSVMGAEPAHQKQNRQEFEGANKGRFARFPEDHVKQEKRKKAIGHIEKLLDQISELRDEIDNDRQIQENLEREIFDSTNKVTNASEMTLDVKMKKIVQTLEALGKKYGCGSPAEYSIQSHHQFSCKTPEGTTRDIAVVVCEEDVSVCCCPNQPQWFEGNSRVEDSLKEVERYLQNPNQP